MNRKTDDFPQFHTINPSSECVHVHDEWERPNKRNERTYDKYVVSSALFLSEYFEYRNNERTNNNHNNDDKFTTIKLKIVFELIMQILFSLFWLYVGFFGGYFSYMHGMLSMYIPTDNKVFSSCVSVCICVCVCGQGKRNENCGPIPNKWWWNGKSVYFSVAHWIDQDHVSSLCKRSCMQRIILDKIFGFSWKLSVLFSLSLFRTLRSNVNV